MNGIVTIDIGTTSVRASVHDEEGKAFPAGQYLNMPEYRSDGWVEQDAAAWLSLLPQALGGAASLAAELGFHVSGIAVTAQRSSVIPVDREGIPLRPAIMWQDLRTASLAASLSGSNALVYGKTGAKVSTVFSAIKMLWIRRNEPQVFARTHKMVGIQDFALHLLTGRFVTDQSLGSRTNLLDLESRKWDPALLSLFELEEGMLCDLVPPGSVVGGLCPALARASGLREGTPVITAGGDQQCAALGLGLFSGERAVTNTGTGSYLIGHSDRPVLDPHMRLSCNVSALPGAYILEAAVLTTGTVYRWFGETLWRDRHDGGDVFEAMNAEAAASKAGSNGVILIPHFKGAGTPHWDPEAKGLFYNLSLSSTRGDMARAILEGIAIELKACLDLVEAASGRVHSLCVSGGLTKSPLFNQIQADILDRRVVTSSGGEATSLGAWMAGAVAVGLEADYEKAYARASASSESRVFDPDGANRAAYYALRDRAKALYAALSSSGLRLLFAGNK